LARAIEADQIFGREKSQRRMSPGDEKMIFTKTAADIPAPTADQATLEESLPQRIISFSSLAID
jgi:hypothetical protein